MAGSRILDKYQHKIFPTIHMGLVEQLDGIYVY